MKSSVRQVRLKLSVSEAERELVPELRRSTESRFIPDLLSACRDRLHREYGEHRLVFVRRLALRCSFESSELVDPQVARRLGEDLAESVIAKVARLDRAGRFSPAESDNAVVLESAAHRDALAVANRIAGAPPAWFLEGAEPSAGIWRATSELGADALSEFVSCLERLGVLEASLSAVPEQCFERILDELPVDEWPEAARPALNARLLARRVAAPAAPESSTEPTTAADETWPGEHEAVSPRQSPVETALVASLAAVERVDDSVASSSDPARAGSGPPREAPDARVPLAAATDSDAPPKKTAAVEATTDSAPSAPRDLSAPRSTLVSPILDVSGLARRAELTLSEAETLVTELPLDSTQFAGLFYLVRLVLELELAEHLWCAGIPEAPFLTEVAQLVLGESGRDDCAPLLFGGSGTLPPISDWGFKEVSTKSRVCLERWLRARGIDPTSLPSADELSAEFDGSTALPLRTAELVREYAATLTIAFCAALEEPPSPAQLLTHLRHPGRVELGTDLGIVLPMSALETSVRRAGLDFNPGYVPWQRRKIVIRFEERS